MNIETLTELFWEQKKAGNPETPEAFAARYPELQEELLSVLSALAAIEEMNSAGEPEEPAEEMLPRCLGDFRLHEKIGSGGMGSVYRATQLSLNRDVAIKVLSPALASDGESRQRFINEAKIIAALHHPGIVQVYGAGCEHGWCFYVMELIDGNALRCDRFDRDPEKLRKIAEIARQAADALACAHDAHILHRDFKPANLLMDQNGNVHLSDFGISSILRDSAAVQVTRTQEGTLRYMAPEIFLSGAYSFASDQYGFGVTMYELVTGRPCYSESAPGKLIREICEHRFPELPGSCSDLAVVINKCTSFHVRDRYRSMAEVRDELSRILNHEPIRARKLSCFRRFRLWSRRRPAVAALLTVSLILFFAFLSAVFAGYWRTARGLKRETALRMQAERNARVANETLKKIFERASDTALPDAKTLPPSPAMLALLRDLTPYYEEIRNRQPDFSSTFMADLRFRMGKIAMQAGEYEQAEKLFEQAASSCPPGSRQQAECMNLKASAALRADDAAEAEATWTRLADTWENSSDPKCRLIAADALRQLACPARGYTGFRRSRLSSADEKTYLARAEKILKECRRVLPDDPETHFLAACFSAAFPDWQQAFTPGEDPFAVLSGLAGQYPQEWKYQQEFIQQVLNSPFRRGGNPDEAAHTARAISFAERLLVMMPFNEKLIADTIALYRRRSFRKRIGRNRFEIYREQWHLIGFLKPIAIHPQTSDASRELMLDFLLTQLQNAFNRERPGDFDLLSREIQDILSVYKGERKEEFQAVLDKLK